MFEAYLKFTTERQLMDQCITVSICKAETISGENNSSFTCMQRNLSGKCNKTSSKIYTLDAIKSATKSTQYS